MRATRVLVLLFSGVVVGACGGGNDDSAKRADTEPPPAMSRTTTAVAEPENPDCRPADTTLIAAVEADLIAGVVEREAYSVASKETPGFVATAIRVSNTGDPREGNGVAVWSLHEGKTYVVDGLSMRVTPNLPDLRDKPGFEALVYDSAVQDATACVRSVLD
jgi:hypothetical protein